jgi:hypothetical protein
MHASKDSMWRGMLKNFTKFLATKQGPSRRHSRTSARRHGVPAQLGSSTTPRQGAVSRQDVDTSPRDAVKCDRIHARGAAQAQASRPHAAGPLHGVKVVIPTPIQLSQSYLSFSFRLYHKLIINFTFMLFVQLVPQLLTPHICMLLKDKNNLWNNTSSSRCRRAVVLPALDVTT